MVKYHYIELFKNDPHNLLRAKALAERTYELSQFLVDILGIIPQRGLYQGKIAYHPSCHLLRGMRVDRQPKALLKAVGVEVIPLEEECCGFGGVFSVDQPQLSTEMLKRKLKAIENSGAPLVVAADVSCLMHIEGGLRHAGSSVRCAHLAQILSGNVTSLR
jgi:L-lactate dehydrogenase complex protein LldE